MASVQPKLNRQGQRIGWQARWLEPDTGLQRSKTFKLKGDAARHGARMETAKADGLYIDPAAGLVTFEAYAEAWRQMQVHRKGTADQVRTNLTRHVYPRIGARPIAAIRASELQAMVRALSDTLAPATVGLVFTWVSTIFKAAVLDRVVAVSPCAGVKLPPVEEAKVTVLPVETVAALADGIAERYRALIVLGAGAGLRIAEALGLTVDRVDWLRRTVTVDRQLARNGGPVPTFAPVKDKRNRARVIPVGQVVLDALAAHIAAFGTGPDGLIFTTPLGAKVGHGTWSDTWRAVAGSLGIASGDGYHLLRHFYASALIASGASVKEVQERLGHTSALMTLDIYGHLWPGDDERTRSAIDAALAPLAGEVVDAGEVDR
jgi:integrase